MDMPLTRPTVLSQVTVVVPLIVALVSVMPAAVSMSPVPLPVAVLVRSKLVALLIRSTEVPAAMVGPVTLIPGHRAAVLAQVTCAVPFVMHDANATGAVRFAVPTDCRT
ncbi:hypothetical protein IMCC26134_05835 [Verrucomicrobia bacterium IMCC26134]|nr:hypothetical protein IMCC26134_05835 [Verrucomicrobia bacterium IMCC26134]